MDNCMGDQHLCEDFYDEEDVLAAMHHHGKA